MAMRLALAVGEPDVDAMMGRISWRQFVEWSAFFQIEPFGAPMHDALSAALMTMVASAFGDKGAKMDKYMLFNQKKRKQQSADHLKSVFRGLATFMDGRK